MARRGIPTIHQFRRYRSLLEAKWASFFRSLGWQAEYEPFELDGYIPDFLLYGKPRPVLVEIKPVTDRPIDVAAEMSRAAADRDEDLLILGVSPLVVPRFTSAALDYQLGWIGERHNGLITWGDALMGVWRGEPQVVGFCHADGDWRDRITGRHDRCIGGLGEPVDIGALWAKAANEVQWQPARPAA